jgi:hypothetical protein
VTGFLTLEYEASTAAPGRLYVGSELPVLHAKPDAFLIPLPRQDSWHDVRPRRFRYLLAVGTTEITAASVFLTDLDAIARCGPFPDKLRGVFGVELPVSPSR